MASIEKRGQNAYRITVSAGYDSKGKKIRKHKSVTLDPNLTPKQIEKELQRQATLFEEEVQKGTYLDGGKITFSNFIDKWLEDYAEKNLAPKTLYRYKELITTRIIPALGHIRLEKLQPTHLLQFYNNLAENGIRLDCKYIIKSDLLEIIEKDNIATKDLADRSGVSEKTIKSMLKMNSVSHSTAHAISSAINIDLDKLFELSGEPKSLSDRTILHHHRLISSLLTCAVQWQLILNNPADRVKPPKVERKQAKYYDETDTLKLLESLEIAPLKYRTALNLVIFGGMRLGELSAMTWDDVDLDNCYIRIRQASQYLPGEGSYVKETKNESSDRIISMPVSVMELLKQYKAWQNEERLKCGDQWQNTGFVFTQWDGKPIFPDTISKWFSKFRKANILPELTFHQLRHTNASLLISQGVNIQTVSKRLGHARASTTTDIYAHALQRPDKEAADKLENLFNKDKNNKVKQA